LEEGAVDFELLRLMSVIGFNILKELIDGTRDDTGKILIC
jgi:hypothetical protein